MKGNQEPDKQSGLLSHPLTNMTINVRDPTKSYVMVVRAVAKKGIATGTGCLEFPAAEGSTNVEPRVYLVDPTVLVLKVNNPSFSTEFTDLDVY